VLDDATATCNDDGNKSLAVLSVVVTASAIIVQTSISSITMAGIILVATPKADTLNIREFIAVLHQII
jgi:hypothetical protein